MAAQINVQRDFSGRTDSAINPHTLRILADPLHTEQWYCVHSSGAEVLRVPWLRMLASRLSHCELSCRGMPERQHFALQLQYRATSISCIHCKGGVLQWMQSYWLSTFLHETINLYVAAGFKAFLASSAQIWINQYRCESLVAFDAPCCPLGLLKETIKSQNG